MEFIHKGERLNMSKILYITLIQNQLKIQLVTG